MSLRRLPRNVTFLGLVSLLNDVASEMIYPLLPLFVTQKLGLPKETLGLIEGAAEGVSGVLKGLAGRLSDTLRKRKVLVVVGYALSTAARPLIGISEWSVSLILLRLCDRAGKGLRTSPRDAMIAQSTPPDIYGLAFGFHRALDTVGAIAGPLLAIFLFYHLHWDYQSIFLFTLIPSGLGLLLLLTGVSEVKPPKREAGPRFRLSSRLLLLLLPIGLFSLGKFTDTFLLLRAEHFGVSEKMVPALYLVMNITYAALATPIGGWTDRVGRVRIVPVGFFFYAAVCLGFGFGRGSAMVWALFALHGVYYALTEGVQRSLIADFSKPDERGTVYGIYHTTVSLLQFPASVIAGALWDWKGGAAPFLYGATLALSAGLLFFAVQPALAKGEKHTKRRSGNGSP